MSRDDIELINRFNGGSGGVSLVFKDFDTPDEQTGQPPSETGRFLSVREALNLAADLVVSALGSWNQEPQGDLADAVAHIRAFAEQNKARARVVLPVKGP